jgi:hypothetical protein
MKAFSIIPFIFYMYFPSVIIYIILDIYVTLNHWDQKTKLKFMRACKLLIIFVLLLNFIFVLTSVIKDDIVWNTNGTTFFSILIIESSVWAVTNIVLISTSYFLNDRILKSFSIKFGNEVAKNLKLITFLFTGVASILVLFSAVLEFCGGYVTDPNGK